MLHIGTAWKFAVIAENTCCGAAGWLVDRDSERAPDSNGATPKSSAECGEWIPPANQRVYQEPWNSTRCTALCFAVTFAKSNLIMEPAFPCARSYLH
jgi:hypothetical protein